MQRYVLGLEDIDRSQVAEAGGKGAQLAELSRLPDIVVPGGFCVTTAAFRRVVTESAAVEDGLGELARVRAGDRDAIRTVSDALRRTVEGVGFPDEVAAAIGERLAPPDAAWAVRSSATGEDLATSSFAGLHDSYLNVVGSEAVLRHIRRCWGSLFSERAVTYRLRNGIDHRNVFMAVVVQRMVFPRVSGVLFTADPVTGNRRVASVEASYGLGEALVSGRVEGDVYQVRDGEVVSKKIGGKVFAVDASPDGVGGTRRRAVEPESRERAALTDAQILRLVEMGRRMEAHQGCPQDVEWCVVAGDGEFQVLQSRPITTLFPVPAGPGDSANRVYLSVGHQQMMTDAMKPLGVSVRQLTAARPMYESAGRLFVDVTAELASAGRRAGLLAMAGKSDPLTGDALQAIVDRGFVATGPEDPPTGKREEAAAGPTTVPAPIDPEIVAELIANSEASLAGLKREIATRSGAALFDFLQDDMQELRRLLFEPRGYRAILAGMEAAWWLNERLGEWLGEKNAADALTLSVANNVTSEMGLALLDVADAIRPYPEVVEFLEGVADDGFLDALPAMRGGSEVRDSIRGWLDRYGMRCVGEIDITRPRWSERPLTLLPLILAHVRNFGPGEGGRRFEQGLGEAQRKEQDVLARLRALPDGERKAEETAAAIRQVRAFAGYREYPKYGMVARYFVYKQALLGEADGLVRAGVLRDREDCFYLTFEEFREAVCGGQVDYGAVEQRKEAFRWYQSLTPPRVLTSEGEAVTGSYRREGLPKEALVGLAVSAGVVEGRARVILDMGEAELKPGDILVTVYTDPSWTPLFVGLRGLVTEVGGLMTHGSVIAREYGLPAVVGVENATKRIRDGQRIRVHGTEGYVEVLPDE